MDRWTNPEVLYPSSPMNDDGSGENSWDAFHEQVRKQCGTYLRSKGDKGLRGIMDGDIARSSRRGRLTHERREVDKFFEQLEADRSRD